MILHVHKIISTVVKKLIPKNRAPVPPMFAAEQKSYFENSLMNYVHITHGSHAYILNLRM